MTRQKTMLASREQSTFLTDIQALKFHCCLFQSATNGIYKTVWENNIKSMENVFDMRNYKIALKRVQSENFVILGEVMSLRHFLNDDHSCDMMIPNTRFFKSRIGIAARKNFPSADLFNQRFVLLCLFYCVYLF